MKITAILLLVPILAFGQSFPKLEKWAGVGVGTGFNSSDAICKAAKDNADKVITGQVDAFVKENKTVYGSLISDCICVNYSAKPTRNSCSVNVQIFYSLPE